LRFEYYHGGLDPVPKLSIDGTVDNAVHFSHWRGNTTAAALKADTSTEIALNLVKSPNYLEYTQGIELVTNNHFDTDGLLSVWTVLTGPKSLELHDKLVAAAEAGDFSEFSTVDGVRASIAIQGGEMAAPAQHITSPLADSLAGGRVIDEARAYELVLPQVEHLLTHIGDYEALWRDDWSRIEKSLESFSRGDSRIEEHADIGLSVITLAPGSLSLTAISHNARGQLYLIASPAENGWHYRVDYPYYSWADTVRRSKIPRADFSGTLERLNALERDGAARWKLDNSELTSVLKGASSVEPDRIARELAKDRGLYFRQPSC
jgi:hypothetical protein